MGVIILIGAHRFIRRQLVRNVKGSAGFESVLMFPLMAMSMIFMLYMFLVGVAFIQYNNLANVIAQDLNMRQSGYSESADVDPNFVFQDSNGRFIESDGSGSAMDGLRQMMIGSTMEGEQVAMTITGNSGVAVSSANYSVKNNEHRFYMPGVAVDNVYVEATRNGVTASNFENVSMSGTIIKVVISYRVYGITFKGAGYNIIT